MKLQYKLFVIFSLFLVVAVLLPTDLAAQCPMCKMSAESNLKGGGSMGRGLNNGILYMLLAPYFIVGGIALWWWRNNRTQSMDATEMEEE
jgi:hypothetical protein